MASAVYPKVREQLLSWALHSTGPADNRLKICGVGAGYVYNAAHNELSDLGANITIPGLQLAAVTVTDGVLGAADPVFNGVTIGGSLKAFIVYFDWTIGNQLVCYIDQAVDASLPQTIASSSFGVHLNALGICKI